MGIYSLMGELTRVSEGENRGVLANLRRLLGERRGHMRALRHVVPHLSAPDDEADASVNDMILVAGLFGAHPDHHGSTEQTDRGKGRRRNIGDVCRMLRRDEEDEATERRFHRLLEAHREQLESHLRQVVGLAKSAQPSVAIDYIQLYWDLRKWQMESRKVQFNWARSFYGSSEEEKDKEYLEGDQ